MPNKGAQICPVKVCILSGVRLINAAIIAKNPAFGVNEWTAENLFLLIIKKIEIND